MVPCHTDMASCRSILYLYVPLKQLCLCWIHIYTVYIIYIITLYVLVEISFTNMNHTTSTENKLLINSATNKLRALLVPSFFCIYG